MSLFFHHRQGQTEKERYEERGWWSYWNAGLNKFVLDLALGVIVPATLITINTLIFTRAAHSLNKGAHGPIPLLLQALILIHVSLPHVSGNEGEGPMDPLENGMSS